MRIERLHLEEDAGKLLHEAPGGGALPGQSLVDYNRCGVPLVEIVSRPDMSSAAEAQDYLQTLHQLLLYTGTSDGNMEEGSLRCDANVSVRRRGETKLGTKVEVKNLNSFRNVGARHRARDRAADRRSSSPAAGSSRRPAASTPTPGSPTVQRSKEEAHDYRYFPEPDLPPLVVTPERLEALRAELPELPWQRRARFVSQYGLPAGDAQVLTTSRELADYYEAAAAALPANPKGIANWVMGEVLRDVKERKVEISGSIPAAHLAALVGMVDAGTISHSAAKEVFAAIWRVRRGAGGGGRAAGPRPGLGHLTDRTLDRRGHRGEPAQVEQYRAGKAQVIGFLVGQVMKRSGGRAEPKTVQQLLKQALEREPVA